MYIYNLVWKFEWSLWILHSWPASKPIWWVWKSVLFLFSSLTFSLVWNFFYIFAIDQSIFLSQWNEMSRAWFGSPEAIWLNFRKVEIHRATCIQRYSFYACESVRLCEWQITQYIDWKWHTICLSFFFGWLIYVKCHLHHQNAIIIFNGYLTVPMNWLKMF